MNLERTPPPSPYEHLPQVATFTLTSDDLTDGDALGDHLVAPSLGGSARSPQLSWSGAPDGTASYAVTCYDPDAPTISGFWHWMIVNLPATTTSLPAGVSLDDLPEGAVVIRNDAGEHGFYGAEPPPNDHPHRYLFSVHALEVDSIPVDESATPTYAAFNFVPATIARATLVGTFAHDGSAG